MGRKKEERNKRKIQKKKERKEKKWNEKKMERKKCTNTVDAGCYAPINIMPHYPPTGLGGARWGFVILASTKTPPLGATLADKSPLIPYTGGGVVVRISRMEENGAV